RLALVLYQGARAVLVGVGEVPALAAPGARAAAEQVRLQKWLQAVSDRLRLADQPLRRREEEASAQVTAAWETVLTLDHLLRRLRVHREPERNQRRILEAA